jgi:hypothetical protein
VGSLLEAQDAKEDTQENQLAVQQQTPTLTLNMDALLQMKNEKERELDILNGMVNDKKEMVIKSKIMYQKVGEKCHYIQEELEKAMNNQHELIKEEKCM